MKKSIAFLLAIAFLAIFVCEKKVDIETEKARVKLVCDQFVQALETENMEMITKTHAHDDDMVMFGTDAAERWVGWESFRDAVQNQFDAFESVDISVKDQVIKVHESGRTAWFSEIVDFNFKVQGQPVSVNGVRVTGIMDKRDGNWVIIQSHTSVPVVGQAVEY